MKSALVTHPNESSGETTFQDVLDVKTPSVLVVDDDPDILRIVQFYLKKQNYIIFTAPDGEEALNILRTTPDIELVLSDVMMPRMNGLELLKAVRENPALSDLSMILISAEGQTAKKVAGLDLGADDYITKPFNFDELMARVRNHLRLRRLQREVVLKNALLKARNDQLTADLEAARTVQQALLPHDLPSNPRFDLEARYIPLDRVGGDFFDVVELDDGKKLGIIIADVCGHGVGAAFITAMTKISFRNNYFRNPDPGHLLSQMNRELQNYLMSGFVTVFYVLFDFEAKTMAYASGGHPPVFLFRKGEDKVIEVEPQSTFLGFFPDAQFETSTLNLGPGDRVFFYTDGVYEGTNPEGESYGMQRVSSSLSLHRQLPVQEMITALLDDLMAFLIRPEALEDDITLLAIEIK
ncbi:MAG: SpoIIE family protein phosphatase [Deltaproteobacteria bacterium]|nr:SpoIIE family protein phosphatase [Deltaproteobacteria bacterium]